MLIALFSDVHANEAALSAVLDHIDRLRPDHVFALGDMVGRGPRPQAVVEMMRRSKIRTLRGNWDEWVAGVDGWDARPKRRAWVEAARRMMRPRHLASLLAPPQRRRIILDGVTILLAHGSPRDPVESLTPDTSDQAIADAIADARADVVVVGHSHKAFIRRVRGTLVINVGSVGYPFYGDPRACFGLLHLGGGAPRAELIRVPYRMRQNLEAMRRAVKRGIVMHDAALRYECALLGDGPEPTGVLDGRDSGCDLLVKLLAKRIRDVYEGNTGVRVSGDEDRIRNLRVATRRLREACTLVRPILPRKRFEQVRRRLRSLSRALGQRRSAGLLLAYLSEVTPADTEEAEIVERLSRVTRIRAERTSQRLSRLYTRERVTTEGLDAMELAMEPKSPSIPLSALARRLLRRRIRRVRQEIGTMASEDDHEGHHRLRIQLRRLRYLAGILREPFPTMELSRLEETSKRIHNLLGELNDTYEITRFLESRRARRAAGGSELERLVRELDEKRQTVFRLAREEIDGHRRAIERDVLATLAECDERDGPDMPVERAQT